MIQSHLNDNEFHPNGSTLCLACGLCCSGALFTRAFIHDHEVQFVESLGLSVFAKNQRFGFHLPCPQLDDKRCTIYAHTRPSVCGGFQCDLLKKYLAGDVTLSSALESVARLQDLLQEVKKNLPEGIIWEQISDTDSEYARAIFENPEQRQAHPELMMAWARFNRYTQKHFQKNKP